MLSRRSFFSRGAIAVGVLAIAPSLLLTGCAVNIKQLLSTIVSQMQAILKVATPNASWLTDVESALVAVQAGISNWDSTGLLTEIDSALNAALGVLGTIPQTALYAPLVAVLVTGIETVLGLLLTPSTATNPAQLAPLAQQAARVASNPYHGKVLLKKPHAFQTQLAAYKEQWNSTASSIGLPAARI